MEVSNNKINAIIKDYPGKSIAALAVEHDLSKRQVKTVLRQAGRLRPSPFRKFLFRTAAAMLIVVTAAAGLLYFTKPSAARFILHRDEINVLVITIDTLRADRLGGYGWKQAHTPNLDDLAQSGVRFANAFSHQPLTLPSHATIFTGTNPAFHGIEDNGIFHLAPEAVTLAELLKDKGFATGAVVSSFVLNRQFGLDQGFDDYDDRLDAGRGMVDSGGFDEMKATSVSNRGIAWIKGHSGQQWFLWLHYYDVHATYDPPEQYRGLVSNPYDGEVAYVDAEVGRVLQLLNQLHLREKTLIVLTADHGEGLGEHGERSHGLFLYDTTQHVPLIFSMPGTIPPGVVQERQFPLCDVMPTILAALGIKAPADVQGQALVPWLYNQEVAADEERPILMETFASWHELGCSPSLAIRYGDYKYIQAPRPELYNLAEDPYEAVNLYNRQKVRAHEMSIMLANLREHQGRHGLAAGAVMDDNTRDRIESLGYMVSSATPTVPDKGRPDAKDMLKILDDLDRAQNLESHGRVAEAIALLEQVVAAAPENRRAINQLGALLMMNNQNEKARQYLERLIAMEPSFIEADYNLGMTYINLKLYDQARDMANAMFRIIPRSANAYDLLGLVEYNRGDYRNAIPHFQKAIELYPTYHQAMGTLGDCYYNLGDRNDAIRWFEAAIRIQPGNPIYRQALEKAIMKAAPH